MEDFLSKGQKTVERGGGSRFHPHLGPYRIKGGSHWVIICRRIPLSRNYLLFPARIRWRYLLISISLFCTVLYSLSISLSLSLKKGTLSFTLEKLKNVFKFVVKHAYFRFVNTVREKVKYAWYTACRDLNSRKCLRGPHRTSSNLYC